MGYYESRRNLTRAVAKHGGDSHDQSDHGNWADGGGGGGDSGGSGGRDISSTGAKVRSRAMRVYADANDESDDAYERRQLDWRDRTNLSVSDARAVMEAAVPNGYNEYSTKKVFDALAPYQGQVRIQLAREGSPAMYLYGPDKVLEHIANKVAPRIGADEIGGEEAGALRLWWD